VSTILVVDDEPGILQMVEGYLAREGFTVVTAIDGPSAVEAARRAQPDLIVLDVMLPGLDGIEVCRQVRAFSNAYIIMLTARADEVDKIVGLAVGADDYVTKPFSPRELVARVKAHLRRPSMIGMGDADPPPRLIGDLALDVPRRTVVRGGVSIDLTPREFDILAALFEHPGRVFTRTQLLDRVWQESFYDDHVVDVHVGNLRRKLEPDPSNPRYVETVRGVGYRMRARPRDAGA
jgi:DNA-binding response OmpR family regulator